LILNENIYMPVFFAKHRKAFVQEGLGEFPKRDPQSYPQSVWTEGRKTATARISAGFAQDLPLAAAQAKVSCLDHFEG
jgi:hypothetical protein